MNNILVDFLHKHRIAVLAISSEGNIHASTVHYSHTENPLTFIIQTDSTTRKAVDLVAMDAAKAALVIGTDERELKTLQLEGVARRISEKDQIAKAEKIHHEKFPGVLEYLNDTTIFIEFIPTWWRFTDFTTNPYTIITGD